MKGMPVTVIDPPATAEPESKPVGRLMFVQGALLFFALVIVAQLVRWQIIERRPRMEEGTIGREYREEIPSQRGAILDRNGAFLALNDLDYLIDAAPNQIPAERTAEVAQKLSLILGRPVDDLLELLSGDGLYAPIERRVPRDVGEAIIALKLPGILVKPEPKRIYPEHSLAAQMLGFVAGDGQGYYGLEGFYDDILRGEAGLREGWWNPWTQPVSFTDRRASDWKLPQEGHTIVLTIDRTIQYLLEKELRKAVEEYGAESGCILVMNPKTGAMIAMASYPTYDPNNYAQTAKEMFVDPIISSQYEPGSTFKIVTMAAALDTGTVSATDMYNDLGYIEVGGRIIRNWDDRSYGPVSMIDVMVHSLNTGAAHVSTLLGPARFYQYVDRFGFGRKTGIDLEGEAEGLVRRQGDAEWHESDLGTNAFGQGLAATPLQMIMAAGAIANRGFLMRPYVVEQLIEDNRVVSAKQVAVRQVVREDTARMVTQMMVEVVEHGATLAQVDGYRIAGKTGTAQTPVVGGYDPTLTIASFIGFAPADDPQFVALVKLDKPTNSPYGSTTAAPTFARVAQILFTQLAIPPDSAKVAAH
jgi:cell division protein FtsI/penicillin-binding protein 2